MSALDLVREARHLLERASGELKDAKRAQEEARKRLKDSKALLDARMVAAVDWGGVSPADAAEAGGYHSHASVRDARRRVQDRELNVW